MNRSRIYLKFHTEIFLCSLLISVSTPSFIHAQTKGGIRGRVVDKETLEGLEGATVAVQDQPWGGYTGKDGEYRIFNLTPGTYDIRISLIGYTETTIHGVMVRSGEVHVQNVELAASPIQLEGTVIEASRVPILQPDVTESRQTVSDQEIKELPVDNIEDIIELQSGVVNGTIRGGRIGQEVYVIDGVTVKNFLEGSQEGLGVDLGILTVQELSLVTSGFSAEYGQALSGVINLVTKEGGTTHDVALRVTSDALMPKDQEYGYNRLELSMGGPLDSDKKFRYFFSVDGIGRMDAEPVSVSLDLTDGRSLNRLPHNEGDDLNLFGKISYWATKDLKLSWSLLSSRDQRRFLDPHYKYNLENTLSQRTRGNLFTFALNRISSSSSARANILDARVSLYRNNRYLGVLEDEYFGNRSDIFGFSMSDYRFRGEDFVYMDPEDQSASGGAVPGYEVPSATGDNAYGVRDTSIFIDSAQNSTIARTLYEFVDIGVDWDNRFESEFAIKTGSELKLNHTQTYQRLNAYQPGGVPNYVEFYPVLGASYIQGQITSPGLVLDLGLRFDMFLPRINYPEDIALPALGIRSSEKKYALNPRLGTTILITENNLFRINYGVFRQTPDFQYLFDIAFTDPLRAGNRRRGNPDLQFEKTTQYEFAYSRALTEDFSITAGAYIKQLENLVASRITELSAPQNAIFSNEDFGSVRGMELVMRKRMNSNLGFTATYTYQEAKGMVSDAFDLFTHVVFDPFSQYVIELGDNEFPLDFDQRHTANISIEAKFPCGREENSPFNLPFPDLHILSTLEYGCALPYTQIRIDTTVVGGGVTDTRVRAALPNAYTHPHSLELNLMLSRGFESGNRKYTLFVDVRNLFNRQNVLYYDPWTDSPWNSEERLRRLAHEATEGAVVIPAESADYHPQSDQNGDRVITPDEQEESYYRALVDRWSPVLSYDEPRQVRFGMDIRF